MSETGKPIRCPGCGAAEGLHLLSRCYSPVIRMVRGDGGFLHHETAYRSSTGHGVVESGERVTVRCACGREWEEPLFVEPPPSRKAVRDRQRYVRVQAYAMALQDWVRGRDRGVTHFYGTVTSVAQLLRDVLGSWEPTQIPGRRAADDAVRALVEAVLAEYEMWKREKEGAE